MIIMVFFLKGQRYISLPDVVFKVSLYAVHLCAPFKWKFIQLGAQRAHAGLEKPQKDS